MKIENEKTRKRENETAAPVFPSSRFLVFLLTCILAAALLPRPCANAADSITEATITVTNFAGIATNGTATLTVNGDTRTATNIISANPAIFFYGTNSMLHGKTNLYNHLALYPIGAGATRLTLINIGTNSFKLRGQVNQAVAGSVAGLWGTISFSTVTITNFTGVTVPLEYYSLPEATNIAYELTRFFSLASNAVAATATGLSNHLSQFVHQIASNKTFYASTNRNGAVLNAMQLSGTNAAFTNVILRFVDLTGVTNLAGFMAALTNGYMTNVLIETDATNRFGKVVVPGTTGSINIGGTSSPPSFVSGGLQAIGQSPIIYLNAFSDTAGNKPLMVLQRARGGEGNSTNVLAGDVIGWIDLLPKGLTVYRAGLHITAEARGDITDTSSAILGTIQVGKTNSGSSYQLVLGFTATDLTNNVTVWYNSNLTALATSYFSDLRVGMGYLTNVTGWFGQLTATNLLVLSGSISNTHIRESSISNVVFSAGGTNVFAPGSDISFGRSTVATVANGHNTIGVGTNVYVDLTGSPTAAWTWGGISGGNRDGKFLVIRNSTGFAADILHNSGTEPTASFRITTPTSTNITLNASGWAQFIYDPAASRWQLIDVFNTATPAASATNALVSLSTNGVQVTGAWTNLNVTYFGEQLLTTNTSGSVNLEIRASKKLFKLGTAVTVTNTTSRTSLITNACDRQIVIKANTLTTNMAIHIVGLGHFTSASANITEIGLRMNNGTLICTNLQAYATSLVNDNFGIDCWVDIRAIGASGSVLAQGNILRQSSSGSSASGSSTRIWNGLTPTAVTIDFTADQVLDVYIAPGATTHGLTMTSLIAEVIQ